MKNLWLIRIVSIAVFAGGIFIKYIISSRKFNRRSIAGREQFSSYGKALTTTFMEKVGNLLAILLILAAIFAFILTLV